MNVLIVGLGSIAQKHIYAIKHLMPETVIFALRSGKDAQSIDGINNIQNIKELSVSPDFIIISNPSYLHAKSILDCLELKRPIMIEKPVFHSYEKAREIIDKTKKNKIITYVACNFRFHPVIRFLKNELEVYKNRINEVNVYCGSYLPDWRPGRDFKTIYSSSGEKGGGVHLDLIHEIDYTYWLFGKPEEVISVKRNVSSLKISAFDFAVYHLLYKTFTVNITLNYYRKDTKRGIEILTDNDTWYCDLLKCNISNMKGEYIFTKNDYQILDTYVAQMKYFVDHVQNNQQTMNNVPEAFDILKLALKNGKT